MAFPPLSSTRTVRWGPAEGAGLEHLTLRPEASGIVAQSVVIGARGGQPYGVSYRIACDAAWRVSTLDLRTTDGRRLALACDGAGAWEVDGKRRPDLDGCIDIDLAGTPFTNTLPIRRLDLAQGAAPVELAMVYIPFDSFTPVIDGQIYRCLRQDALYGYEAADRSFRADLPVDADGLVLDYPTLFERLPA